MKNEQFTPGVKEGDFVGGAFKYGTRYGKITEVGKRVCKLQIFNQWYEEFIPTEKIENITTKRITQIISNPKIKAALSKANLSE